MSSTLQPFGMNPIRHINGKFMPPPRAIPGGIASGYGSDIFFGSPVIMSANGTLVIATSNADIIGAFAGCQYVVNNTSLMTPTMQWTANGTYVSGSMVAYVWDDPGIIYEMQGNGSYAATTIGQQADFVSTVVGSGQLGRSVATLSSVLAAGSQGQMRIVGLGFNINNAWGDSYTIVETMIARHQNVADKVSY